MAFYLDGTLITDAYLRSKILLNDQTPELDYDKSNNISENENSNLENKLNLNTKNFNSQSLIEELFEKLGLSEDSLSKLLSISKSHLIAILYLYKSKNINKEVINMILDSSNDDVRSRILIEQLDENIENKKIFFSSLLSAISLLDETHTNSRTLQNEISSNIQTLKNKLNGFPKKIVFPSYNSFLLAHRGNPFRYAAYPYHNDSYKKKYLGIIFNDSKKSPPITEINKIANKINSYISDLSFFNDMIPIYLDEWTPRQEYYLDVHNIYQIALVENSIENFGKEIIGDSLETVKYNDFVIYNLLNQYNAMVDDAVEKNKIKFIKKEPEVLYEYSSSLITESTAEKILKESVGNRIWHLITKKEEYLGETNNSSDIAFSFGNTEINKFLNDTLTFQKTFISLISSKKFLNEILDDSSKFSKIFRDSCQLSFSFSSNNVLMQVSSNLKLEERVNDIIEKVCDNFSIINYNESDITENISYFCKRYHDILNHEIHLEPQFSFIEKLSTAIAYNIIDNYISYIENNSLELNDAKNAIFKINNNLKNLLLLLEFSHSFFESVRAFNISNNKILNKMLKPEKLLMDQDVSYINIINNKWNNSSNLTDFIFDLINSIGYKPPTPVELLLPKKGG